MDVVYFLGMKKIIVEKSEGIAEVIDKMLAVSDAEIIFVIPKDAALTKSASSFRLLKREASLADKKIAIETTDSEVIDVAAANGIAMMRQHGGEVSDIVPKTARDAEEAAVLRRAKKQPGVRLAVHAEEDEDEEADEESQANSGRREELHRARAIFQAAADSGTK